MFVIVGNLKRRKGGDDDERQENNGFVFVLRGRTNKGMLQRA